MTPKNDSANCAICALPLLTLDLELNLKWHAECQVCEYCKAEVTYDMVLKFIADKITYLGHAPCHEQFMQAEIEKRPLTVTQGLLDYLNEKASMCTPNLSRSVEDNMSLAENAARKVYHHITSLEEKYVALKMMQNVCAAWSVLLSQDKNSLDIHIKREAIYEENIKRTAAKVSEAEGSRATAQHQKEIKREKKTPDWKAIQGLVATGAFTEETAREFLKTHKKAAPSGAGPN